MTEMLSPEERIAVFGGTVEVIAPRAPRPEADDARPGQRFGRLCLLTLADLARLPPRQAIIQGLVAAGDLCLIYGAQDFDGMVGEPLRFCGVEGHRLAVQC